jgi:hypothetical protein
LNLHTGDGNDTIHTAPSETAEISIHGGDPHFGNLVAPDVGDTLHFDPLGNTFSIICGTILTDDADGPPSRYQPVHYRSIENLALDPAGTDTLRFDMDSTLAATQSGYTSVLPTTVYNSSDEDSTFGWNAPLSGFDRGATGFASTFTNLLRDGHWQSGSRTFTAEVEDGWYLVSVKTGDRSFARDRLQVSHGDTGQVLVDNASSPAGQIAEHTFLMQVQDGTLDLTFANLGGDPYWVVNGIDIRPGRLLTFGSPETDDPLIADGVTQTTFTGYRATPDSLVTIDPQLDTQGDHSPETTLTILEPDADPNVAGHQVWSDGAGVFTYTIVHPSAAGTLRVRYAEVTGLQASCFAVEFEAPEIRRFDFNTGASPTQTPAVHPQTPDHPGYVGVLPTHLNSPAVGYGWATAVQGFDRGIIANPASSDLLRDGASASGSKDFRIQLPPGQNYDVTVTFGDASFARDRMNVTVVTGTPDLDSLTSVTDVATAAGQFVHRSFIAAPDAQGELVLRISDGGGDPYWTVNSIEVRPAYSPFAVQAPGGSLQADGAAVDTFTIDDGDYTPNAWYTLSTTAGRIATLDQDSRYAGVQVQAPASGPFTFQTIRGTAAGTAEILVEEINGASRGAGTQVYVYAAQRRFDFNGSGVATQLDAPNDFWSVRGSDVFVPAVGHGWNAAVSEFQRSTTGISKPQLDSLYRDGHWQSAVRTFQVGVDPTKSYDLRIHTGDRSFARNQLQITVEGIVQPLVATAANEFEAITVTVPANTVSSDGILDIQFANLGGDPYWVVNGIEVAESRRSCPTCRSRRLRLRPRRRGSTSARRPVRWRPISPRSARRTHSTRCWATAGRPPLRRSTAASPTPLLRDGHWGTNNTFSVQVANGSYYVNVTLGDASFARNNISVWAEGILQHSGLATAAGQFIHRSFEVEVTDGQLNVQIASTGGDPYFTINALEIFPAQNALTFSGWSPGQVADGATSDRITVSGATSGALYTVSADLGTIVGSGASGATPDASPHYAGFQVLVPALANSFTFDIRRPTGIGTGTPQIRVEEVTGLTMGELAQTYSLPAARRFDFNGSGNVTQTGFTGVRGNTLYNANNGYGWNVAVPEFQRGSAAKTSVALYRDGHWGSAVRTFQVAVVENTAYNVRAYVGDPSFARNNLQVSVEGGTWQSVANTGANQFATVIVPGTSTNGDGLLTVRIRNAGGDPYWVINGIDVWTGTPDPAEAPLLASDWSNEMQGAWLTEAALAAVVPLARDYWVSTGLNDVQLAELYQTPIAIGDLSYRGALGVYRPEGIWLDASGAGLGWNTSLLTPNSQLLTSSYDLLTVVTHELGHALGYDDLDGKGDSPLLPERPDGCCAQKGTVPFSNGDHIMAGVLEPGVRRVEIAGVGSGPQWVASAERDSGAGGLCLDPRPADMGHSGSTA